VTSKPQSRTLRRAVSIAGSKERLAALLKVTLADLEAYLAGTQEIPDKVFLAALDVVAGNPPQGES
jgi:hypothetical protein